MTKKQKYNRKKRDKSQNTRPTIGLLCDLLTTEYSITMWQGVCDAAKEHGINLIYFSGGLFRDPDETNRPAEVLYDLVNTEMLDGLVIWGAQLVHFVDSKELSGFCKRYHPLPIVNIGLPLEGIHSLLVDNRQGMRDVVTHLIEVHGHRRIMFMRGPEDSPEAQERYRGYGDSLAEHGIPLDPVLITGGDEIANLTRMGEGGGIRALLDKQQPGVDFDAIVGYEDNLSIGVLKELQARGFRVPYDVAVASFDDLGESQYVTPPLTTAQQSFYNQGWQATEMLLALLAGEEVSKRVVLPMKVMVRQSCGCMDSMVVQAVGESKKANQETLDTVLTAHRTEIIAAMTQAMGMEGQNSGWVEQLLTAFAIEMKDQSSGLFLRELDEVLRQVGMVDGDPSTGSEQNVGAWQNALSALRLYLLPYLEGEVFVRADNLWQQARVMIGQVAERTQAYQALQAEQQAQVLREVSQTLITTFDVEKLMNVLAEGLPRLGIPGCYLSLYETPHHPTGWSRLRLAYDEKGRIELEPGSQRFSSHQLIPEGLWPQNQPYSFVIEPLFFQKDQIGFVLLKVGPRQARVYEALRGEISSALKGALLVQQEEKRSRQLQTVAEVSTEASAMLLDTTILLQKVVDLTKESFGLYHAHIYLLDTPQGGTGEEMLVLTAGAGEVGRKMVADGWRISLDAEQSLVAKTAQTRQGRMINNVHENPHWLSNPLLPDTCAELAVPLIAGERLLGVLDVQSDQINTFTEDDIQIQSTLAFQIAVALENAKLFERLGQANAEIKVLNERLQEENVRMIAELNVAQQLQEMLLPNPEELQQIEGMDIAGHMKPADEVGGDYYDVLEHNGRVKIGIGDVTGHGLESGVVMLMVQTAVRTLLTSNITDPIQFMDILNRTLHKNIERMNVDKSLSLVLVDYAAGPLGQVGEMRLSGQHEQLIVVRKDGQIELLDTLDLGFPVGLIADIGDFVSELAINLESGDGIVLYSDGITEAENEAREFYGLERLCQVITQHWPRSAEIIKQAVVDDVQAYIGDQTVYDDITLLVVKQK